MIQQKIGGGLLEQINLGVSLFLETPKSSRHLHRKGTVKDEGTANKTSTAPRCPRQAAQCKAWKGPKTPRRNGTLKPGIR